jgi:hypothetical protein
MAKSPPRSAHGRFAPQSLAFYGRRGAVARQRRASPGSAPTRLAKRGFAPTFEAAQLQGTAPTSVDSQG